MQRCQGVILLQILITPSGYSVIWLVLVFTTDVIFFVKEVQRRWEDMRDCFHRKLHLHKQPKSAFVNEVLLSVVPAFKTQTMTRSVRQRWKCWALYGKPKIWCLSLGLPSVSLQRLLYHHTHEYNFQSQNISTVPNIPNNTTVNSPTVSDALSSQSVRNFGCSIDKTVVNNEYSEFVYLFQIKL